MARNKVNLFSTKKRKISAICKALSHPARVAIINFLIKKKECTCSEVVNELPLSQSTVSQHLKELKNARLINSNIDGSKVCYCIDQKRWNEAGEIISMFLSQKTVHPVKPC